MIDSDAYKHITVEMEIEFEKLLPELRKEYQKLDADRLARIFMVLVNNGCIIKPGKQFEKLLNQLCWAIFY